MSVPNPRYITYPFVVDGRAAMQRTFDYMRVKIPGWEPSEGQLDVWLIESISSEAADVGSLSSQVDRAIFRYFGESLLGIRPLEAIPASFTAQFNTVDTGGYTVRAGTQVAIANAAGTQIAFVTRQDLIIPAGAGQGQVTAYAVIPGVAGNSLGSAGLPITLVDILWYISSVNQVNVPSGGQDAETDSQYLSRLSIQLQTLSLRPILPIDFSILARNVAGVQRATTIDGYNPAGGGTFNNERMVTVVSLDVNGAGVNSTVRTAVQTYLDGLREITFVVNVTDPTITIIDINTSVKILQGFTVNDVLDRIRTTLNFFLDPSNWGIGYSDDPNAPVFWVNSPYVRYSDVVSIIRFVPGVAFLVSVSTAIHGGSLGTSDILMSGVAPLPQAGTFTITGSLV